jgi:hypothetical protein
MTALDRVEDPRAVLARLGQRMGEQVQDELLVGLARGVDAHVAERRGGQQAAQQVERLRLHRARARGDGSPGNVPSTHAAACGSASA